MDTTNEIESKNVLYLSLDASVLNRRDQSGLPIGFCLLNLSHLYI